MTQESTVAETAKERIKRKKKEKANEAPSTAEEASIMEETEVLEIYPYSKVKSKWIAQSTVKIKVPHVGIELRNIVYSISKDHRVKVQPPFRYYKFAEELDKADAYVESIKFLNRPTWKEAVKKIKKEALDHHRNELPEIENSSESK